MRDRDAIAGGPDAKVVHLPLGGTTLRPNTNGNDGLLPAQVRGLSYDAGGMTLVKDVDLVIKHNGITVIMGPNGAGKSLLLRLLHGLIAPAEGTITWGSQQMGEGKRADEAIRRRQAMVFQRPVLLRRSVAANIDFVLKQAGRADPARRRKILDDAGLAPRADQPARLLSGGEQQRLALARALATEPEVLFMDEPTANLDPASTLSIEEIVQAARDRGTKIIFVTHDIGQARRLAADVVFMHRGRIIEHAPADTFFDHPQAPEAADYMAGKLVI